MTSSLSFFFISKLYFCNKHSYSCSWQKSTILIATKGIQTLPRNLQRLEKRMRYDQASHFKDCDVTLFITDCRGGGLEHFSVGACEEGRVPEEDRVPCS